MIDREGAAAAVRGLRRGREGLHSAGRAERGRLGAGHLAQRTTGRPLGDDDAARAAADHVEHPCEPR
ncbi:hypothetical protein ACYAFX_27975 [Rhodococcus aetherivorans]